MSSWLRDVLLRYLIVSVPIYVVVIQPLAPITKLAFAYAMLIAFLYSIRQRFAGGSLLGEPRPYRGDKTTVLWLTTVGYFLLIMAVRLPIYARVQLIFEKTPMIVLVFSSLLIWERFRMADFGMQAHNWPRQVVTGILLFILAWTGVAFGFLIRELVYIGPPQLAIGASLNGVVYNLLMFGYGNFAEELFFRGYAQTKFRRRFGPRVAIVLQAVLFALYHVNYRIFPQFDPSGLALYLWFTFTFGIVMGIIVERTRGLIAPTIVHIGYNVTWPGGLLWLGYRSARPFTDTLISAALPWLAFLIFTAPLAVIVLNFMGYRRARREDDGAETAQAGAV
jgi:membrane protease YdiL (CAAX protease family)